LKSAEYHTTIYKLPLATFIDVAVDGDLNLLTISGQPTKVQLAEAWESISEQYNDVIASGSAETWGLINLYKAAMRNDSRIKAIESFISVMQTVYVKQFANAINKILHTSFKFDHTNKPQYYSELKRALQRSKGFKVQLQIEQSKILANLAKKQLSAGQKPEKPTREYFMALLLNVSDAAGFDIDERQITVYKFCERLKRHNRTIEKMQEQNLLKRTKTISPPS
jgi:hypothetical protein